MYKSKIYILVSLLKTSKHLIFKLQVGIAFPTHHLKYNGEGNLIQNTATPFIKCINNFIYKTI